jgi:hypothetical protein
MRKRLFVALLLLLLLIPLGAAQANKPLKFDSAYTFGPVSPPPPEWFSCEGGTQLAWIGTVQTTIDGAVVVGDVYYCMHFANPPWEDNEWNRFTGVTNHWSDAYFDIYIGETWVLRGEGGGTSTFPTPPSKFTARWRSTGVITYADGIFASWDDRPFNDGGYVVGIPPFMSGEGKLTIH